MLVAGGSTNVTTYFTLRLVADGTAATGLTITGIDLQYVRSGAAPSAKVDATELTNIDDAHADNKAKEVDATDQPGLYRVDWPDAVFAAGVREVILSVKVATAFTEHLRVEIDGEVTAEALGTQAKVDVNAEGDQALTDYNGPTSAELVAEIDAVQSDIATLNNLSAAQVQTEVDTAIATARLDELLAADSDIDGAAPPTVGSVFHELLSKTVGSFTFDQTTDSLEAVRDNQAGADVGAIADAVWEEAQGDHVGAGTFGVIATEIAAIPTTAMRGTDGANTTTPPTVGAIADQVWDEDQANHVSVGTFGIIASEIADTLVDTAVIGTLGAGLTAIPWNAAWDAEVQSEVADALGVYDPPTRTEATSDKNELVAFVNDEVELILADTSELQAAWVDGGRLDLLLDAIPTTAMRGTNDALLAANVPTNFADFAITATTGLVDVTQGAADKVFSSDAATLAELSQGVPPVTPRPDQAAMLGYMSRRNRVDVDADFKEIHNDAGTVIAKKALSDDDTTYSEAKAQTGA